MTKGHLQTTVEVEAASSSLLKYSFAGLAWQVVMLPVEISAMPGLRRRGRVAT